MLGNHDLHLLARAAGLAGARRRDTLVDGLTAPDCAALCAWLRARPLLHREGDHASSTPACRSRTPAVAARFTAAAARALSAATRSPPPAAEPRTPR
ncbi:MAG: hypothetical protein U0802_12690 [Candidatus Binatia bacterium]